MQEVGDERMRDLAWVGVLWSAMGGKARAVERHDSTTAGRLFKSGFEKPVHEDSRRVAESGAWCNDLGVRCHTGELQ
ncbi:hypothetical protein ACVWYH_007167 [Bradyrhizobium sp. GM24.11]